MLGSAIEGWSGIESGGSDSRRVLGIVPATLGVLPGTWVGTYLPTWADGQGSWTIT